METCPNHVLGKVSFFNHRHARVEDAEACKGCKKCVRACPNAAIHYLFAPPERAALGKGENFIQPANQAKIGAEEPLRILKEVL